jgi:hypothetical protein
MNAAPCEDENAFPDNCAKLATEKFLDATTGLGYTL